MDRDRSISESSTERESAYEYKKRRHYYSRSSSRSPSRKSRYRSRSSESERNSRKHHRDSYYGLDSKGRRSENRDLRPDREVYQDKYRRNGELEQLRKRGIF